MPITQIKARGVLLWWGKFRFMYMHAIFYVGAIQMVLIAATAYNTTLQPWMTEYLGWSVSFWQYCLVLGAIMLVGMITEFTIGVPAVIAVSNEQSYKHQSPIKSDFEAVKAQQAEMQVKLDKIMKRLEVE